MITDVSAALAHGLDQSRYSVARHSIPQSSSPTRPTMTLLTIILNLANPQGAVTCKSKVEEALDSSLDTPTWKLAW